jgi:hypothetical protein
MEAEPYRAEPPRPIDGDARAWLSDGTVAPVTAASPEAVGIELSQGVAVERELLVSLGDAHVLVGPLEARLGHLERRVDGSAFAVLHLLPLRAEQRRQLADVLMQWPASTRRSLPPVEGLGAHLLEEPRRIETVLDALAGERVHGLLRTAPDGPYTGARLVALPPDRTSDLPLRWKIVGPAPQPPFVIEAASNEFVFELPVTRARLSGEHLHTDVPASMLRLPIDARWLRRVPPEQHWEVEPEANAVRPLVRASSSRLAFVLRAPARPEPGRFFEVLLRNAGRLALRGRARVESIWPAPESADTLCTVRFEPHGREGRTRWDEALERIGHPDTRRAGTWAASLWELYDKSGYFQLSGKTSAHFSRLRQSFAVATRRLDTVPELGCQVVWPSPQRVEAALSALVVYAGTAMVYQVARRRDAASPASAREMLRAINVHAFEHLSRDPTFEWTLVYVQEGGARWSHLAYQVFTEAQLATGLSCVVRFRAMEWQGGAPLAVPGEPKAGPATEQERALLTAVLSRVRPRPYLEALDLVPSRFDLAAVRARWAGGGFSREREVLVARERGRPLAAAVVESADDALHLFGLLDSVRFYRLSSDGDRALRSLVAAAHAWFAARGKQTFVCFFEAEQLDSAPQPGLYDLGAANLLAFPRPLMPDFLEHLYTITAPRAQVH